VALAWGLGSLGQTSRIAGALEAAETHLLRTTELLEEAGDHTNLARNLAWLGLVRLNRGGVENALCLLETSSSLIRERRIRCVYGTSTYSGLAEARLMLLEQTPRKERRRALALASDACRAALHQGRYDRSDLAAGYRVRGTYEWLCGHPWRAQRWWRKSLRLADEMGARHERALTVLEMGRRLGEQARLEQAAAEFEAMGAGFDLAQAHELLGKS
jgi:hypothetical protein